NRDGSFVEPKTIQRSLLMEYHKILKSDRLIDYDLLLYYSHELLSENPSIPKILSNLFELICVDEYQDTQDLLYAIISTIVKAGEGNSSLFLVGDVDQAIYQSLGGVAKSLDEIKIEIDNLPIEELTLSGNYRSNQRIIDFYRNFQNEDIEITAIGKNAAESGIITFNDSISKSHLVDEISRLIQLSLNKGISENEICVLVPQWWLITSIARKLKASLPDVNFDASGLAPMSRNRENIWYKLSRLLLTQPQPKIYSLRYRWANEIIELFRSHIKSDLKKPYESERNLLRLLNSIESEKREGMDYLNDCFDQFIREVGIDLSIYPKLETDRKTYFENVKSRLEDPDYNVPSDIESFKSFYREMTGVVINTCVGVKGEEFETVISFGLLNGYIPHWNEIFNGDPVEAARKLLYVICSRAKNNLHLISEYGRTTRRGDSLTITPELEKVDFEYDEI
ncbi:MAG: ATP-dependent helicase, partial [Candidatus Paceibacterota bacterium]